MAQVPDLCKVIGGFGANGQKLGEVFAVSRPNAAFQRDVRHAPNGSQECCRSQIDGRGSWSPIYLMLALEHCIRGPLHFLAQFLVDLVQIPLLVFVILHPLEITDSDAARVDQDIGQDGNAALEQDLVCRRSGWTVGRLADEPRSYLGRIIAPNPVFQRGRD